MVFVTFVSGSDGGVKLDVYNAVPLIILKLDIQLDIILRLDINLDIFPKLLI